MENPNYAHIYDLQQARVRAYRLKFPKFESLPSAENLDSSIYANNGEWGKPVEPKSIYQKRSQSPVDGQQNFIDPSKES